MVPLQEPAGRLSQRRVLIIFGGLMLGMLLAALDQTIVATALPVITGHLGGVEQLSLVVTAYLITSTVSTPLFGKVSDLFGRKPLFILGIVVFLIGSILSGTSQNMTQLVLFRGLQGVGGGGLMAMAQVIIGDVVSPRERGRYQGFLASVFALATVVGPLLGGAIVDNSSWRWVFYINVPVGIVALAVAIFALDLPPLPRMRRSVDYMGAVLLGGGITGVLLAVTWGGTTYPWASPTIIGLGVGGAALLVGAVLQERRAVEPILPPRLFRLRNFNLSGGAMFLVGMGMLGATVFLPEYLQIVRGVSATESGLLIVPMMGGMLTMSITSGALMSRFGRYKIFPVLGTATAGLGMWLLSHLTANTGNLVESLYMVVLGLGVGMVMPVMTTVVHNTVEHRDLGVGTAAMSFFRSMGGSFGAAIFGAVLSNRVVSDMAAHLPPGASGSSSALMVGPQQMRTLPPALHQLVIQAFDHGIHDVFLYAVPFMLLAFLVVLFLREVPLRQQLTSQDVVLGERTGANGAAAAHAAHGNGAAPVGASAEAAVEAELSILP